MELFLLGLSLIMGLIVYIWQHYGSRVSALEKIINGESEQDGMKADLQILKARTNEHSSDILEIKERIENNQAILTNQLIAQDEKITDIREKLSELIGYMRGRRSED
jgi:predicted  nucleic acid-binding Zn-ribbon protein